MSAIQKYKTFDVLLDSFLTKYQKIWWETSLDFPDMGKIYSPKQQRQKESEVDRFIKGMRADIQQYPSTEEVRVLWKNQAQSRSGKFFKNIMGFSEDQLEILFQKGFTDSTLSFYREVKSFDSEFKLEDTFQAIRNVWIMNAIQVFLGREAAFTPSIFAYSLLYPYTDNYLDDPHISGQMKIKISKRFEKRLAGEMVDAQNSYELALFLLVHKIEGQYPREEYPRIYESLLGIHRAQFKSLMQQDKASSPYEMDILGISMEKGGVSVLTDAYLVNGTLTEEEAEFMFAFGVILQLADDLQDIRADIKNGHMTLFSQTAANWKLDSLASRLFGFISRIMEADCRFSAPQPMALKELIQYNCRFLMLQAIAKHQDFFSKEYQKRLEVHSPFSFSYLRKMNQKLEKEYQKLNKRSDSFSLEEILLGKEVIAVGS